jgi:hypothetical protein
MPAPGDERVTSIITALVQRRPVVVRSIKPIDALAQSIWDALPDYVRRRASVATWAFDNANHFDLVALPRLERGPCDASDLILAREPITG